MPRKNKSDMRSSKNGKSKVTESSSDGKDYCFMFNYVEFEVKNKRKKRKISKKAKEGISAAKECSSEGMRCVLNLIYAECGVTKGNKRDKGKGRARDVSSSSSEGMAVVFLIGRDFAEEGTRESEY
jgi:hypothetical protein